MIFSRTLAIGESSEIGLYEVPTLRSFPGLIKDGNDLGGLPRLGNDVAVGLLRYREPSVPGS